MRWILVLILCVLGCTPAEQHDFVPLISICTAFTGEIPDVPDEPDSDECDNCGGLGYLGDGTVRVDCPACETPWQKVGDSQITGDAAAWIVEVYAEHMDEINRYWEQRQDLGTIGEVTLSWLISKIGSGAEAEQAEPLSQDTPLPLDEAKLSARDRGVPLLVIWTQPGCAPCERLKRAMKDPAVAEALSNFAVAIVDRAESPDEAAKYGIRQFPFQTVTYRGQLLFRDVPSVTEQSYLSELRRLAARASQL